MARFYEVSAKSKQLTYQEIKNNYTKQIVKICLVIANAVILYKRLNLTSLLIAQCGINLSTTLRS